jgi:hypothetical protein
MAAVLAGGPDAHLSDRAAGDEWGLITWNGRQSVTVPKWRRSTAEIEFHVRRLRSDEVTTLDGIPITTVTRTLLDLAIRLEPVRLVNAVEEAEKRGLASPLSLPDLLERHAGERGTAILRTVLREAGYGVSKGELELAFRRFVADRGLPTPERNGWIDLGDRSYSPDCLWRDERLIVELHSARHHGALPAVTRDATRDRLLLLAGWRVIHVTWAQLHSPREAAALERDLRAALRRPTV